MIKHLKITFLQRKFIKKNELNILLFKNLLLLRGFIVNEIILKYLIKELYLTFNRFASRSRATNVCLLTGRTRAVYRKTFKTTRMQIREKANTGFFPGIRKSS